MTLIKLLLNKGGVIMNLTGKELNKVIEKNISMALMLQLQTGRRKKADRRTDKQARIYYAYKKLMDKKEGS